jgi:hypothetical protein
MRAAVAEGKGAVSLDGRADRRGLRMPENLLAKLELIERRAVPRGTSARAKSASRLRPPGPRPDPRPGPTFTTPRSRRPL